MCAKICRMAYNHQEIEPKWQKRWEDEGVFQVTEDPNKKKWYTLIEFPYPSGAGLHVGHVRSFTAWDIASRLKRRQGMNVLYPIGFDAFGLPTENYALKNNIHPRQATEDNIANFTLQIKSLGLSFDWSRAVDTTDPKYYKWTQWIFLQLFKAGLAYQAEIPINWCPKDKIGLANEEVLQGKCERCGTQTVQRLKRQWMLKITAYADRLIDDLKTVDYLPQIAQQQINWIGRSHGINITYPIADTDKTVTVFTTRPDTNFGATFVALAPDGQTTAELLASMPQQAEVKAYTELCKQKAELERVQDDKEKTGVFTGLYAVNHLTGFKIPVYVSDFVLGGVGTGALVGVPGHDLRDFQFAQKMQLKILRVVVGVNGDTSEIARPEQVQEEVGTMVNSDFLNGLEIHVATEKVMEHMVEQGWGKRVVNYKLRDWVFSRQRYWGEPIPIIHCAECGPQPVPDEQLPVVLPDVENYKPTDTGESPLANMKIWKSVACPNCGGHGERETDVMPNWAGSSWYFLRYTDPKNDAAFASPEKLKYWMPVDIYNGGMEHTTLHLLYSRFWHKFLFDQGLVPTSEPYARRVSHGMVLAADGKKMSKSIGNVVNPDDVVAEFGADTVRMYEMFMGPYDEAVSWDQSSIKGVRRFLDRTYNLSEKVGNPPETHKATHVLHQTLVKIQDDIQDMKFNTAVSAMMMALNELEKLPSIAREDWELFLHIVNPFAPHLTEELWEKLGQSTILSTEPWPQANEEYLKQDTVRIIVQVNGKVRAQLDLPFGAGDNELEGAALANERVQEFLTGKIPKKVIVVPGRLVNIVV